jgi:hypothetical protein
VHAAGGAAAGAARRDRERARGVDRGDRLAAVARCRSFELQHHQLPPVRVHHLRQAQAILRLADTYPAARLEAACRLAATVDGQYQTVRNLLRTGRDQLPAGIVGEERANTAGAFLRGPEAVIGGAS